MNHFKIALYGLAALALTGWATPALALDSPALTLARQLNDAFIEVADKVSPAVVVIEVVEHVAGPDTDEDGPLWDTVPPGSWHPSPDRGKHGHGKDHRTHKVEGEGSGIVITADGYILTNNHVVENADKIVVRFKDGRVFDGEVKGRDPQSDIAVVKIKASGLTTAALGDSDTTRVGEFVLAIGAPFTLSYSVTVGHVSAKGRSFEGETGGYADQDFIQTDAAINPGNSGGPLVNLYGEVIAINTMIEGMNTGIGFAIPINLAKRVKDHLIAEGKFTRSWIGIEIGELKDDPGYQQLVPDLQQGVVVVGIVANGPASKSELQPADVIVSVDGKPVKTARELKDSIALQKPGHALALDVVRGRAHLAIQVKTEALPTEEGLAAVSKQMDNSAESPAFGLTVQGLTPQLAQEYGVSGSASVGVIITAVERDSPAEEHGIQAGDVITEINRKRIFNSRQFRDALKSVNPKNGIMLNLISNGSSRFVVLKGNDE